MHDCLGTVVQLGDKILWGSAHSGTSYGFRRGIGVVIGLDTNRVTVRFPKKPWQDDFPEVKIFYRDLVVINKLLGK